MATTTKKRPLTIDLLETAYGGDLKVDEDAGVIRGVKILGRESGNKGQSGNPREYSPKAIRQAVKLYEGLPVNFNHPNRQTPGVERAVEDRGGWLESVRESADGGIEGDLHYLKSDPRSAKVVEAAKRKPELFGLSHNARGNEVVRGGKSIVESIDLVRSVDIVTRPATTNSLFESEDVVEKPLKELIEALDEKHEGRALLLEALGDEDDDMAALKRLADTLVACKKPAPAEGTPTMESQIFESIALLDKAGIKPARPLVEALAALKTTEARTALIESLPKPEAAVVPGKKPAVGTVTKSGGKVELAESKEDAPKDGKEFAKSLCG